MAYTPNNPNGQSTMVNSSPQVIASDQSPIPVKIDQTTPGTTNKVNIGLDGQVTSNGVQFVFSTANSTTTQLTSGTTFTGAIETIVNQPAYSILAFSDQPGILTVKQFTDIDGTKLNQTISYTLVANVGFARSGVANGNYIQIIFQNTGLSTTTTLQIDTAYGSIAPASQLNNNPVGIYEINGNPISSNSGQVDVGTQRVALAAQQLFRTTFASVLASNWDTTFWKRISQGVGQVNSQSAGNGVITTGTNVNADTILRSVLNFKGSFNLKIHSILSQRIINQSFFVELVDVIGDNLVCVINSATSVTITIPNNPFTSVNIGQSMFMGAYSGTGTFIPSRYAIASVSGNDVTFTVASFVAGSGTCSLFGWNYHQLLYNATGATTAQYDTQRRGWNSGYTAITTLTTAGVGHFVTLGSEDSSSFIADQLVASSTTNPYLVRGTRVVNIAEEITPLFIQIRAVNGSTAPASNTTWTIGTLSMEDYSSTQVTVANSKIQGNATLLPVKVESGTLGTVTSLTTLANGQTAHSSAATGSPVRVGGRVVETTIASQDQTLVAGDAANLPMTTSNQLITKPFATGEIDWVFASPSGGVVNNTDVVVKAASGRAGITTYVTGFQIINSSATIATEVVLKDNATVIWRGYVGISSSLLVNLLTPLKTTANTVLNFACITTGSAVYVNVQGYTGF